MSVDSLSPVIETEIKKGKRGVRDNPGEFQFKKVTYFNANICYLSISDNLEPFDNLVGLPFHKNKSIDSSSKFLLSQIDSSRGKMSGTA